MKVKGQDDSATSISGLSSSLSSPAIQVITSSPCELQVNLELKTCFETFPSNRPSESKRPWGMLPEGFFIWSQLPTSNNATLSPLLFFSSFSSSLLHIGRSSSLPSNQASSWPGSSRERLLASTVLHRIVKIVHMSFCIIFNFFAAICFTRRPKYPASLVGVADRKQVNALYGGGQVTKSKQHASVGSCLAPEFYLECTFLHALLILKENIKWGAPHFHIWGE